jgi:hypothetical protein
MDTGKLCVRTAQVGLVGILASSACGLRWVWAEFTHPLAPALWMVALIAVQLCAGCVLIRDAAAGRPRVRDLAASLAPVALTNVLAVAHDHTGLLPVFAAVSVCWFAALTRLSLFAQEGESR